MAEGGPAQAGACSLRCEGGEGGGVNFRPASQSLLKRGSLTRRFPSDLSYSPFTLPPRIPPCCFQAGRPVPTGAAAARHRRLHRPAPRQHRPLGRVAARAWAQEQAAHDAGRLGGGHGGRCERWPGWWRRRAGLRGWQILGPAADDVGARGAPEAGKCREWEGKCAEGDIIIPRSTT